MYSIFGGKLNRLFLHFQSGLRLHPRHVHDVEDPGGRRAQADPRLHLLLEGPHERRVRPRDALRRGHRRRQAAQRSLRLRPSLPRRRLEAEKKDQDRGRGC